jgi:catechol 2,3-dioxygenase-like lactoylglutathione lyase family enzyme
VRAGAVLFVTDIDRVARFYAAMIGFRESARGDDHVVLESPAFQLVVHRRYAPDSAETSHPPAWRMAAACKPVFFVSSIAALRDVAEAHGGVVEPADREWSFQGARVCDGCDPEGNVIQLREAV